MRRAARERATPRTVRGVLNVAGVRAATARVFGIRIVAVVLHHNAPQPFHPGDHP
ncbi:MAG: hypothetical protein M3Y06_03345 [Actinomycetota bacterium]|nr:hypothetical protein [Actinomycetota bacterium]